MDNLNEKVIELVARIAPELDALSQCIYDKPELGYEEYFACESHVDILKKHGFDVQEKLGGIDTGFLAAYKSAKPGLTVAYLAEYDALPGIGHGCGHNLLGTMSTGAGIVLKQLIDEVGGTVLVFGTPAEETSGAKVPYAEQGMFDNVDICMMCHPANKNARSGASLALEPIEFEFFGKTAHAAACPEDGINALDGVLNLFNSINAMRQQVHNESRIHGIIVKGGEAANIIPDYAKAQFYVRSPSKTYNQQLLQRVKNCAEAAALASGTTLKTTRFEFSYDNLITNQTMSDLYTEIFEQVSGQKVHSSDRNPGSLDAGQVSQICPTIHPYLDITNDTKVAAHSRELAGATITDFGKKQMRHAVASMVITAIKISSNKELYAAIRKEFEAAEK